MKYVLITGASSGIGYEFVKLFAQKGYNLILVARSEKKLEDIATKYKKESAIEIITYAMDLGITNSAEKLYSCIKKRNVIVDILINNAGIGDYGNIVDCENSKALTMIQLNITTLTELTMLFVKDMKQRNYGKIINVASTASFQPIPKFAIYSATKSYVLNFTGALHFELKGTAVSISALCPGPTATKFKKSANMKDSKLFKSGVMDAKTVAEIGYRGMMNNKMTIIPGIKNKIMAFFSNVSPSRDILVWISSKIA